MILLLIFLKASSNLKDYLDPNMVVMGNHLVRRANPQPGCSALTRTQPGRADDAGKTMVVHVYWQTTGAGLQCFSLSHCCIPSIDVAGIRILLRY